MDTLRVTKINEVHAIVNAEAGLLQELSDFFMFESPGAKFSPAFRNRLWDGKIRMFNMMNRRLPIGLVPYAQKWAADRDYQMVLENFDDPTPRPELDVGKFVEHVKLSDNIEPRDYQIESLLKFYDTKRAIILSPTASGKSLTIYLMARLAKAMKKRVLITVPTITLVNQLRSDFLSYGCPDEWIYSIVGGKGKESEAPFVISTWQSIYKLNKKWFEKFGCVIGDEAHGYKADCLALMMSKMESADFRVGLTGTTDGKQVHKLQLEANFGPITRVASTKELQERKLLSEIKITFARLIYSEADKTNAKKNLKQFADEVDWLVKCKARNDFIKKVAKSLKGNTVLLFNHRDTHAKLIYEDLKAELGDRVFFIAGSVKGDEREEIRQIVMKRSDAIIVATYGTMSTGVNIPNLNNAVFCAPGGKSVIRILQSIGRVLRKAEGKAYAKLIDLVDDLHHKSYINHCLKHMKDRMEIYSNEGWEYDIQSIHLSTG
jgi:superfamily II DNA or RNA helicase